MATPTSGVNRWLTIRWDAITPGGPIQPRKPILFDEGSENEALRVVEYGHYVIEVTKEAPGAVTIWIDGDRVETRVYGIWQWKTDDYAGLYRFEVQTATGELYRTWIRVFPHKMRLPAYNRMKQELSEIALDLLLRLDSPSRELAEYGARKEETSALHDYTQISSMMEELGEVMSQLRRNPLHVLRGQSVQQSWQHITHFSPDATPLPGNYQAAPAILEKLHVRYLPGTWLTQERRLTYDTYENRLLKRFLQQQLVAKLTLIEKRAQREEKQLRDHCARYRKDENAKDLLGKMQQALIRCQQMKERCLRWSSESFLQEVQPLAQGEGATQILLKDPTYNRFYRLYLRFQQHLKITRDAQKAVEELSLKKVSALYELWSVFTLSRMAIDDLLAAGYHITSNSTFFEVEKDYFQFDVQKNKSSIVLVKDDLRVEFKYEPVYPNQSQMRYKSSLVATTWGSDPLTPDMAIEVYQRDQPSDLLIFDAKYKREKYNGRAYPKRDDLNRMRDYRDSIQYQKYVGRGGRDPYQRISVVDSAYIIYPGDELHREGTDKNIGALPLVPGMPTSRAHEVHEVLRDLLYKAYLID
jgi:predicted component of viral defense system (DUF524 family)